MLIMSELALRFVLRCPFDPGANRRPFKDLLDDLWTEFRLWSDAEWDADPKTMPVGNLSMIGGSLVYTEATTGHPATDLWMVDRYELAAMVDWVEWHEDPDLAEVEEVSMDEGDTFFLVRR